MVNPLKLLAKQFLLGSPLTLLVIGTALSLLDFAGLYYAAVKDDVLHINKGIGLLQNYGLISTVFGNTVFFYLAKKYYDAVCSIRKSKALINEGSIESSLSNLTSIIRMQGRYRLIMYLLVFLGAACWISNVTTQVRGNAEIRWGHKVFDSPDHELSFYASRLHSLYSWLIVLPLVGHVVICTSIQLRRIMGIAFQEKILRYDLLNPDQKGGFLFIEKAQVVFNAIIALLYVQITIYIGTFERLHRDYLLAYITITLLLIGVNRIFLGDIYSAINELKIESLNSRKDKAYKDDKISFEILKYCYEHKINEFSILNFIIKAGAIAISGIVKFWPIISKAFTGA